MVTALYKINAKSAFGIILLVTGAFFFWKYNNNRILSHEQADAFSRGSSQRDGFKSAVLVPNINSEANFQSFLKKWGDVMVNLSIIQKQSGSQIEGHIWTQHNGSFDRLPQVRAYYHHIMNRKSQIKRICETGFNGGHSAMMWTALCDGDVSILVFDLCNQKRCEVGKREIKARFPNVDLTIISGDSRQTVPRYTQEHPDVKCDFISVDGGHFGDVPTKDLINMLAMASDRNTMVVDDSDATSSLGYVRTVGKAWESAVAKKLVIPVQPCGYCFSDHIGRGFSNQFCFATYVTNTNSIATP